MEGPLVMRIRTVKPSYWPHRMHQVLSEPAALLAVALLNLADDEGRFEALPSLLSSVLFPRRPLSRAMEECLQELVRVGWLRLYKGRVDGIEIELGVIVNFRRHQVIQRPTPSTLPAPPHGTVNDRSMSAQGTEAGRLNDDSREHVQGKEGRKERKGRNEGGSTRSLDDADALIPTVQEVITLGQMQYALDETECRKFFDHYNGLGWMQGQTRISHWPSYLSKWKSRFEERGGIGKKRGPEKENGPEKAALVKRLQDTSDPKERLELLKRVGAS